MDKSGAFLITAYFEEEGDDYYVQGVVFASSIEEAARKFLQICP